MSSELLTRDTQIAEPSVSYSALTAHRKCPQAWGYRYLARLEADVTDRPEDVVARDFGTWWHAVRAVDAIARGVAASSLRLHPAKISCADNVTLLVLTPGELPNESEHWTLKIRGSETPPLPLHRTTIIAIAKAWWAKQNDTTHEAWTEFIGADLVTALQTMDARWYATWGDDLANEEVLAVELQGTRNLPGTTTPFKGQVDEVYRDKRKNIIVARDAKAHGKLPSSTALQNLMDSQLHLYAWLVSPTFEELCGSPITAVAYDRARMTYPKSPAVTQTGGTLSKSVTDYDLATYVAWCATEPQWGEEGKHFTTGPRKGLPKWGTYEIEQSVVDKLSTPQAQSIWNTRTLSPLNGNIVNEHLDTALTDLELMGHSRDRWENEGKASRSLGKGCNWCDYSDLCLAQMMGGPDGEYDLAAYGLRFIDGDPR